VDKVVRYAFELARQKGVPLVSLGDTHDTKAIMRGECVSALLSTCRAYSDVKFYVLIGNHCLWNVKDDKRHSLEFLEEVSNVYVMSNKLEPQFRTLGNVGFIPYKANVEEIDKELEFFRSIGVDTLFMHQGIKTAFQNAGRLDEDGYDPDKLKGFNVFVGHYHNPHYVNDHIYYIGSTLSHSFGEANQTKSIVSLDTSTGIMELIPSPAPQHRSYTISEDNLSNINNIDHKSGDPVRLVLKGSKTFIDSFIKSDKLKEYGEAVKVVKEYTKTEGAINLNPKASKIEIFSKFIEGQKLDEATSQALLDRVKEVQTSL
jgi:DNA repair exonuclease SbcCD nuclease subunit